MRVAGYAGSASFPTAAVGRVRVVGLGTAFLCTDHEKAGTRLRNAVVGGVEHLGAVVVSGLADLAKKSLVGSFAGPVVVRQCVDVFQDELAWSGFAQDTRIGLQEACFGV